MAGNKRYTQDLENLSLTGEKIVFSVLTYFEIKCGLNEFTKASKVKIFKELCKKFGVMFLDSISICEQAAEIYRALQLRGQANAKIKIDTLLAATAIVNNFNFITENVGDFVRIQAVAPALDFEPWMPI